MKMVLGRNHLLATTMGHMIKFRKGEPTDVPPDCVPSAVAIGAQPADGSDPGVITEAPPNNEGPADAAAREKEAMTALEILVERNARSDFTAAGVPSTDAMKRVLGYEITANERNLRWQTFCDQKAAEKEAA